MRIHISPLTCMLVGLSTDDLTVTAGGVSGSGGLSVATTNLYAADTLHVSGGLTIMNLQNAASGITLQSGNLDVTESGMRMCVYDTRAYDSHNSIVFMTVVTSSGKMDITGGLTLTSQGIDITTNGAEVTGGLTVYTNGLNLTGGIDATGGFRLIEGSLSVSSGAYTRALMHLYELSPLCTLL